MPYFFFFSEFGCNLRSCVSMAPATHDFPEHVELCVIIIIIVIILIIGSYSKRMNYYLFRTDKYFF